MRLKFSRFFASVIIASLVSGGLAECFAQTAPPPKTELEKRQGAEYRLTAFGPDLMGDGIDPHTGTIQFSQTDVSLPGNFPLEVAIRRKRSQGRFYQPGVAVEFGDWQLDVPRINVVLASSINWTGNRCSMSFGSYFTPVYQGGTQFTASKYSNGVILDAGGSPGQQVMQSPQGAQWPAGTTHVTVDDWRLNCITASDGGQGFLAYAPNGDQYRFDRYYKIDTEALGAESPTGPWIPRKRHILAATQVTDVNGNTVNYNYDSSNRLTSIVASDGRRIDLAYSGSGKLIQSVTANPGVSGEREWVYTYGTVYTSFDQEPNVGITNALTSATLPDGKSWTFDIAGMAANPGLGLHCPQADQTLTMTHPYGTVGVFKLKERRHRQSLNEQDQIRETCPNEDVSGGDPSLNPYKLRVARIMSTVEKRLTGPNLPAMVWLYDYESDQGDPGSSASDPTNWSKVLDPEGHQTKYYHRWTRDPLGGKLVKKEVRDTPSSPVLETTTYSYVQEASIGSPVSGFAHATTSFKKTLIDTVTIARESYTMSTQSSYDNSFSSATYSFGNPTTIVRGSSLGGNRTQTLTYEHNKTKWVLGLPLTSTFNGRLYDSYHYDAYGRADLQYKYGVLAQTYAYETATGAKGALKSAKNALNETATFNQWKRGIPQQIIRPDLTSITRVVDNNGWVTSQTDAKGTTTGFTYNAMGWLTSINVPSPWADATLTYTGLGTTNAYSTATVGTIETVVWYDAFLRPYKVRTRPISGGGLTSFIKTTYDGLGQTVFTSLPSTSSNPTTGTETEYDALGRVLKVRDNITNGFTATAYLTNGQTQVTDPKGNVTTTTSRFYGAPDTAEVTQIVQPLGLTSTFSYDTWGNMTLLNQSGSQNGYTSNINRQFWYDTRNRLCRHRAPELGDELFGYDALDRLTKKASGQSAASGCVTTLPAAATTTTVYDEMGRVTDINFPSGSGTPNIVKDYDDNGNLTSVTRNGIAWAYDYNALDMLDEEELQLDGRTYQFTYGYTPEGFLSSVGRPWGSSADFVLNGLGQPTGLIANGSAIAYGGTYFVNGQMAGLSLSNGFAYSATQNSRQLVETSKAVKGTTKAFDATYTYDPVLPRIASITDNAGIGNAGPWGTATYTYDILSNMRRQVIDTTRTIDINYNSANRVSQYRDDAVSSSWNTVSHDARGNVTTKGGLGFVYDFANQPTAVTGAVSATYTYDGNLKRVKSFEGGDTTYSIYSSLSGKISAIDNPTSGARFTIVNMGPVSIRLNLDGTFEFTHNDHLGSPVASTSSSGSVLWVESYLPFGEKRYDPAANRDKPGFTGHIDDDATGLTYMQARYYDPVLARFLSTDPIGYRDQMNLYAYVGNNPVNMTDPSGTRANTAAPTGNTCSRVGGNSCAGHYTDGAKMGKISSAPIPTAGGNSGARGGGGARRPGIGHNSRANYGPRRRQYEESREDIARNDPLNPRSAPIIASDSWEPTAQQVQDMEVAALASDYYAGIRTMIFDQAQVPGPSSVLIAPSESEVMRMGREFVGPSARMTSNGKGWYDDASGRTFRFPTEKGSREGSWANFQQKFPDGTESNVHVRVSPPFP